MRSYNVTITGKTPLLMHADNIEWADEMEAWKKNPKREGDSKAGDDRTPAFRWLGCLYHDGQFVGLPSDNLSKSLLEGGGMVPVGKGAKTFKSQTQSGMLVDGTHWPLIVNGKTIPVPPILALRSELDFAAHQAAVQKMAFRLFVKRAKIGKTRHVRVRPMFDQWSASGIIHVWDKQITADILTQILAQAGEFKGLCDWRPGGPTPGPLGRFEVSVQ